MKAKLFITALLFGFSTLAAQQEAKNTSLHISDFYGYQEGKCIRLSWVDSEPQTLEEIKLEKSEDGIFSPCSAQFEMKSIFSGLNFGCTDHEPESDFVYYRLKRMDRSGNCEYSEIIFVKYEKPASEALVFPNPLQGKEFFVNTSGVKTKVSLFNADGALIQIAELDPQNEEKEMKVESSNLKNGIYQCIIETRGKRKRIPIIVNE